MPLTGLDALADAGGWVVAVAVVLGVLALILRGDLVTKSAHDAAIGRLTGIITEDEKQLKELAVAVSSQSGALERQTGYLKFLVDFVRVIERRHAGG